jgi:hypothetical protein
MLERGWKKIVDAAGSTDENPGGLPPVPRGVSDRIASEADREEATESLQADKTALRARIGHPNHLQATQHEPWSGSQGWALGVFPGAPQAPSQSEYASPVRVLLSGALAGRMP